MVAISGPGWRLAPSLRAYVDEADEVFPNRDTSSDGSIGDLAHSVRVSDHNPDDGYVDAVDLDEDLAPGVTLMPFAEHLRTGKDPRVKYVIYEGRIFTSYGQTPWKWRPYSGPNAHKLHLHLSILDTGRFDLAPWGFQAVYFPDPEPAPDPAPVPTTLEVPVLRIIWFKSGAHPAAAYRCLVGFCEWTREWLVHEAWWIANQDDLNVWRKRGLLEINSGSSPSATRPSIEFHGGPYDNTKTY